MKRIRIDLQHCYGIKELEVEFDFTETQAYAIYAPNGVMKSSLAQTLEDASKRVPSKDRIFPDRVTVRQIRDEFGDEVEGDRVLVVSPYDADYAPTEKTSTLLVDARLKREYERLQISIDEAKTALLAALNAQANSGRDFEHEIASAFTRGGDFETAVTRIKDELEKQTETPFEDVQYDIIFDDKVLKALNTKNLKNAIEDYVLRYNELLAASTFFTKGTFDYYNAGQIARSLAENGFFKARHSINLRASEEIEEIETEEKLKSIIAEEKQAILEDTELRARFDDVAKRLERNAELRRFCKYLQENETLLSNLSNLEKFREDVLKSYLKILYSHYSDLMEKYKRAEKRKKEIEDEARNQQTQWEEVIAIFNDRFFVPFELEAKNRVEVMLGNAPIVELGFKYVDGKNSTDIEKSELLKSLSTGEKKALYVLNLIFEFQRRRKDSLETLVVIDDIADSFDYQNKYAIIQYLDEISKNGPFKLVIMTHNFDFFRTLESRKIAKYSSCLMATKGESKISLTQATGIRNIFANDWRKNFYSQSRKKIASIPFLRNIVEMTTGEDDRKYLVGPE